MTKVDLSGKFRALAGMVRIPQDLFIDDEYSPAPFGGYRRSGSLARDNGTEAMDRYLQTKTIWIATTA